jgi:magnesium transporter
VATARLIELVDPTREELLANVPTVLDPDAVEQIVAAPADGRAARPLLESHGSYVFGVLAVPLPDADEAGVQYGEVDLVALPDAVVVIRKSDRRGRTASLDAVEARAREGVSAGELVHLLVDATADGFLDLVDEIHDDLDGLEDEIERLPGRETRVRLADLRHELLHARRNVALTRAAVRKVIDGRLELGDGRLFPREVELAFADTSDVLIRVTEELDIARDVLSSMRDHLQAKIAEAQNDVIKTLTVIASLVLVPTLITGFYGQNFAGQFRHAYWTVGVSVGLIIATTLLQLVLFRWRRWI